MGKVSEADFREMGARLRARAAFRDLIERDLAARVGFRATDAPGA